MPLLVNTPNRSAERDEWVEGLLRSVPFGGEYTTGREVSGLGFLHWPRERMVDTLTKTWDGLSLTSGDEDVKFALYRLVHRVRAYWGLVRGLSTRSAYVVELQRAAARAGMSVLEFERSDEGLSYEDQGRGAGTEWEGWDYDTFPGGEYSSPHWFKPAYRSSTVPWTSIPTVAQVVADSATPMPSIYVPDPAPTQRSVEPPMSATSGATRPRVREGATAPGRSLF